MDSKSKGRSWVGNIYHKFENIFHDVDEFVTKDTAKFIEDQVQAVNEGVKKLYFNVQGDEVKNKAQEVAEKKDGASGDSIMSMVGVKEISPDFNEPQLSEAPVDSQKQLSHSPDASFSKDIVNDSHPKDGSEAALSETAAVVQKDVGVENKLKASHLSDHEDYREPKLVTMEVEFPEDLKSPSPSPSPPSDVSCGMRTLSEEIKFNSANSEDLQTEYPSKQSDDSPTCKNAEMVVEEKTVTVENPSCENVGCSEDKSLCEVVCVKENMLTANELCNPEYKFSPSSGDVDYECAGFMNHSPETVVSDDRISCVSVIKIIDDYADLSEKVIDKSSLEQDDTVLEVSSTMEHPDSRSASDCGSSSDLPFCFTEEHSTSVKPSLMKDESLCEIKLISASDDSTSDDKFSLGNSVRGEWFRVLENEEEVPTVRLLSGETNCCFENYHSLMLPELGPEENSLVQKHALEEELGGSKDSCKFSVQSKAPSVGVESCSSPKNECSFKPSLFSLSEEHTTTISAYILPATEAQKTVPRPLHEDDKATYAICNDVLSTCNIPSDHESSDIFPLHHVVKTDASSSLATELIHAKGVEKTEEICCDNTHPSCCGSDFVSLSDLGTRDETGFSGASSTASGHFQSLTCLEKYDLSSDTVNADLLETIDLSDEPKLEDIRSMVDKELLYTPSFRYRRFGSYKELIKDAFASRKRLVKEYQQLPIWYGDFDSDNSLNPEKHLSPQTAALSEASTSKLTSSHPCDTGESDWELL